MLFSLGVGLVLMSDRRLRRIGRRGWRSGG